MNRVGCQLGLPVARWCQDTFDFRRSRLTAPDHGSDLLPWLYIFLFDPQAVLVRIVVVLFGLRLDDRPEDALVSGGILWYIFLIHDQAAGPIHETRRVLEARLELGSFTLKRWCVLAQL